MSVRLVAAALLCSPLVAFVACGGEQASTPPPLIPEAASASVNTPSTRPVPATRTLESRTIGAAPYAPTPQSTSAARTSGGTGQAPANAWSPTPVNGVMNPSPPAGTPVYGEMNPSPPGR